MWALEEGPPAVEWSGGTVHRGGLVTGAKDTEPSLEELNTVEVKCCQLITTQTVHGNRNGKRR